jgi:hypothetical protein
MDFLYCWQTSSQGLRPQLLAESRLGYAVDTSVTEVTFTVFGSRPMIALVVWQFWGRAAGGVLNKFRTPFYLARTLLCCNVVPPVCSRRGFCGKSSTSNAGSYHRRLACDFRGLSSI